MDKVIEASHVLGDEVDTPKTKKDRTLVRSFFFFQIRTKNSPGIAVAGRETHEAVGKVVALNEGAELAAEVRGVAHGTVPVTDDGLGDKGSKVVIVLPADTLNGKGNVGSGKSVVTDSDLGANELGLALLLSAEGGSGGGWGLAGQTTEVLLSESDELLVGDTTSTDKDHAVSSVVGLDVLGQVVAGDGLDVLLGAEDSTAERLALVSSSVEVVEDNFLELLVNLLLLTENHIPLAFNRRRLELRVLQNVGEDIDGLGDIVVEGLGVVDGVFPL